MFKYVVLQVQLFVLIVSLMGKLHRLINAHFANANLERKLRGYWVIYFIVLILVKLQGLKWILSKIFKMGIILMQVKLEDLKGEIMIKLRGIRRISTTTKIIKCLRVFPIIKIIIINTQIIHKIFLLVLINFLVIITTFRQTQMVIPRIPITGLNIRIIIILTTQCIKMWCLKFPVMKCTIKGHTQLIIMSLLIKMNFTQIWCWVQISQWTPWTQEDINKRMMKTQEGWIKIMEDIMVVVCKTKQQISYNSYQPKEIRAHHQR